MMTKARVEQMTEQPTSATLWSSNASSAWLAKQVDRRALNPCRALLLAADLVEEASTLAGKGFHVIVVDSDRAALRRTRDAIRSLDLPIDTVHGDLFRLKPSFYGPVELIYDRTFYAGLEPIRRAAWTHITGRILPRHGNLAGAFRIGRSGDGPPHSIPLEDLKHSFRNLFTVDTLEAAGPSTPGEDQVYRGIFRRN